MPREVPSWVPNAVFYQIFPDRFRRSAGPWLADGRGSTRAVCGGDLDGVRDALPYLADLGVTALYVTPIFTASSYHRYDTEDYFHVDPVLGGNDALGRLMDALRARGMRIVLDGVFNHASHRHPFFQDALSGGRASAHWDWFRVEGKRIETIPEPNYACWAGVPTMPEWNHTNPDVRAYLLSVVRHWLREFGIDGWRLDTAEYLPPDFVRDIDRATKAERSDAYVLGEVMGLGTPWFRHDALDGVMHYKLWERLVAFVADERWNAEKFVASVRSIWHSYTDSGNYASLTLLGSHDKPRFLTLCRGDTRKLLLATTFLLTFPGAPAIYYGDELGMQGGEDPDNRRCFAWDESAWDRNLLEHVRALIALRRSSPALRTGTLVSLCGEGRTVAFRRESAEGSLLVVLNADAKKAASAPRGIEGRYIDLLSGEAVDRSTRIPPLAAVVARRVA